jgi:triosephosphate isomerase
MLAEAGCRYVIVGHSERRQDHGESDALIAAKAAAAHAAGLVAIICVGETGAERDAGQAQAVVSRQLAGSSPAGADAGNTVIAYEPVWAIGTGRTASPEQAQAVHALLRSQLKAASEKAGEMKILYGGSVKADNAATLFAQPDIDGGLIGGASLKASDFVAICRAAA